MTQIFVKSSILDDNNIKKNTDNNIKNNTDNNNNNTNIIISVKETPKLIFVYNDLLNTIPLKNIVLNEDIISFLEELKLC